MCLKDLYLGLRLSKNNPFLRCLVMLVVPFLELLHAHTLLKKIYVALSFSLVKYNQLGFLFSACVSSGIVPSAAPNCVGV